MARPRSPWSLSSASPESWENATPYTLVIFDFDGTLADSLEWFGLTMKGLARRYRFREVERDEFERMRGDSVHAIMRRVGLAPWKVPFLARHLRQLMARDIDQIRLFPGIGRMLQDLHGEGVRLAVVSSNTESNIRRVLGAETEALIDHYACGVSLFGKSAKFREVAHRSGVNTHHILAIGDEIRDIDAAERANIAAAAVAWGYAAPAALRERRPTIMFETVDQIFPYICPRIHHARS